MSHLKPYNAVTITLTGVSSAVNITSLTTTYFNNDTVQAFVTCESAAARFFYDGSAPTTDVGHLLNNGDNLTLEGLNELLNFRVCPDTTSDSKLVVTYSNAR